MGVARATISFNILLNAFVEDGFLKCEVWKGIPYGAEILNGGYDEDTQKFFVDFEHPDFEDFEEIEVELILRYADE